MEPILLAAAVHDREPRVEIAAPGKISISSEEAVRCRVSFRLADHSNVREEARLEVRAELADQVLEDSVEMHDHLFRDDETWGSLDLRFEPLPPGEHLLAFEVVLRTSVTAMSGLGKASLDGTDVRGQVRIHVS